MKLRPATKSDASSLAALSTEVWLGTYIKRGINARFADYALTEFTTEKFEDTLADPDEVITVCEHEDGIIGFVRVSHGNAAPANGASDTEISTLYVQPRHHGQGVGAALLAHAFQQCGNHAVKKVWLATNSDNTPAIAFYLAQGFQKIGQTRFQIGDESYPNDVFTYQL
ncbi:GNAT family N-acetyltransferase [Aliiroseovarius sediminis]|uniref:GNAT family N-acetyltransferase n=1 Tax=Aliiroseovarius sediminis TaxID=2925839 RepID=UPI001F55B1FB|nr:GNAT family N-acetyltransferase [Aliiroseovarius sediminis]MCI2394244.1 GNAT family N-acetyltransferase [Aliiroseovarius sediminis]